MARDEKKGKEAAATLVREVLGVHFLHIEPTDPASGERARNEVESTFGVLDLLITNAGVFNYGDMSPAALVPTEVMRECLAAM